MAISLNDIVPKDQQVAAPAPAPASAAPDPTAPAAPAAPVEPAKGDESGGGIPDAVLQIPAFGALLRGAPPALSIRGGADEPEMQVIKANVKPLLNAGFGFYKSSDGTDQIIFNSRFTDTKELVAADKSGKLDLLAPPFVQLKQFFAQNGAGEPPVTPTNGAAPVAPTDAAPSPEPPPVEQGPPPVAAAPAGVQNSIARARLRNNAVGSPSSGPSPGSGRLLNSIIKPTV